MTPSSLFFSSVNVTFPHLQGDGPYRQKVLAFFQQLYYLQTHSEGYQEGSLRAGSHIIWWEANK